jgi:hypothetical protein
VGAAALFLLLSCGRHGDDSPRCSESPPVYLKGTRYDCAAVERARHADDSESTGRTNPTQQEDR